MRLLFIIVILLAPAVLRAQGVATLVADTVFVDGNSQLIASGNIEAFYDGNRLQAEHIIYDRVTDTLIIRGAIVITTADGAILTADQATLDPRLENGMLRGARLVLNQQLQLAANQINRIEGRYAQLYKVAVTSCHVCQGHPPLWEIRAQKVVHDAVERQLYFTGAQFRLRGVPIIYIPRMRLPDPTLTRATGLLLPRLRTTNQLGTGIKLPYFIALGDYRDLTLTPYLSNYTRTFELRYRQSFVNGDITVTAAGSQDTLLDGTRSYLFADGSFELPHDYKLRFDIEAASDPAYLLDYGYSEKDRLDSNIQIERVQNDTLFVAGFTYFQTLRDDEVNASLPPIIGSLSYERRLDLDTYGTFDLAVTSDIAYRYSNANGDAGRDVGRIGASINWQRRWISGAGLVTKATAGLRSDWYAIEDDSQYATSGMRHVPSAGIAFTYPIAKTAANGTRHLVTPTLALSWADQSGFTPPNEDSTRAELDQSNIFATSHFPADDAVELGAKAAAGITWTRIGAEGTTSTLTFGRIVHDTAPEGFNPSSGLDGLTSDWLLAGQAKVAGGFDFEARTLFDDDIDLTRAAARLGWRNDDIDLNMAYIWQAADPTESRPDAVSEITLDTVVALDDMWAISANTRYDLANDRPARAGVGVQYKNECVTVDLSASRRYTSSSTVEPETSYGLSISLTGFSAGRSSAQAAANCSK